MYELLALNVQDQSLPYLHPLKSNNRSDTGRPSDTGSVLVWKDDESPVAALEDRAQSLAPV